MKVEQALEEFATIEQILDMQYNLNLAWTKVPSKRASAILRNKKLWQEFVLKIAMDLQIPVQSEEAMRQLMLLVQFYQDVCDTNIATLLETEHIIEFDGEFQTLGLTVAGLSIADMMEAYKKKWKIDLYQYSDTDTIEHKQRSESFGLFLHRGGAEPDAQFLKTSFNQYIVMDHSFANAREYVAMTGLYRFVHEVWMDVKGWTRTSSLWSVGRLVDGRFLSDASRLFLDFGDVSNAFPGCGPRQLKLIA